MLALAKTNNDRGVEIRDFPVPLCGDNEVVIEVQAAGICGSDLHVFESLAGYEWIQLPVILGHEFAGKVLEVGKCVSGFKIGERVTAEPALSCERCYFCRTGYPNICENRITYGLSRNGAFAKFVAFPERSLFHLPDAITFEEGACLEPLGVALHALEISRFQPGDSAMIIGPGPIGLFLSQLLACSGAYKIFLVGLQTDQARMELGAQLSSAQTLFNDDVSLGERVKTETAGRGPDIVFDCSGSAITAGQAINLVRPGGQVIWVSIFQQKISMDGNTLVRREVDLQASRSRIPQTWFRAMRFLEGKKVRVNDLVTHRVSLEQAPDLFETLLRRKGIKGMIFPNL
jgi:L-iditol 2-dehydrogenase